MQGDAANELDIEMNHVPGQLVLTHDNRLADQAACGVLHRRKRLGQNLIESFSPCLESVAKLVGLGPKLLIAQGLVGPFEFVDPCDQRPGRFQELTIVTTRKAFEEER
jgi:hypothetical protein